MNVKELKEILSKYPDDMEIWTPSYSAADGVMRVTKIDTINAYDALIEYGEEDEEYLEKEFLCIN